MQTTDVAKLPVTLLAVATGLAMSGQDVRAINPLIGGVESIKHSVARVMCASKPTPNEATPVGTGFFTSSTGTFFTAAHILKEIRARGDMCRSSAVVVPVDAWDPSLRDEFQAWFEF